MGPSIIVRNKQMVIRRGERVTLRCEADGDLPLEFSWRSKGKRIDHSFDVRYHIKNSPIDGGIVSEMTIIQTLLTDRGEYSCVANNEYGHDHSTITLQVQEPPNFPRNLHVTEYGSRSIVLAWSSGNDGNGENSIDLLSQPISNYILQYKESHETWNENNNQKLLPGEKTLALITSLRPDSIYNFRLFAENHLGTSSPSDILHVHTESEPPTGPPQKINIEPISAQQLLVTWRPPEKDKLNGELLGYTIGYRKLIETDKNYNFTRVSIPGGEVLNDFRLTGLSKYTQYSITVQAFNIKGDGPSSEPIIAHTLEDVPSAPPQLVQCNSLSAQNIQVSWQLPPKDNIHGIIQGYKLLYEPTNADIEYIERETKITSSLNTVLHGLQPFTNYSVQVLSFTRAGEGQVSSIISCSTEETVPDAPERVKSIANSETSAIISWLPPRRLNGVITKYTVFIRILEKGREINIIKENLPSHKHHYEAKDLKGRETYEAWITASTQIGQGPSTPVIKLSPSSTVSAGIISFGQTLNIAWRVDVKLACIFIGMPKPTAEWRLGHIKAMKNRLEISNDNTLTLRNVQRSHQGNYSCYVKNSLGSDHIVYQIFVQSKFFFLHLFNY